VVDGCFTLSIEQPMPKDGRLTYPNCGGDLEFGEWGGSYAWRCVDNRRHHVKIHRNHLKLPKMAALVPNRDCSALEKQLASKFDSGAAQFISGRVVLAPKSPNTTAFQCEHRALTIASRDPLTEC